MHIGSDSGVELTQIGDPQADVQIYLGRDIVWRHKLLVRTWELIVGQVPDDLSTFELMYDIDTGGGSVPTPYYYYLRETWTIIK